MPFMAALEIEISGTNTQIVYSNRYSSLIGVFILPKLQLGFVHHYPS